MFFSTPHNGIDKANWFLSCPSEGHSGNPAQAQEYSELLHAIEKNSETLETITDQFAPLMKQFCIFFFWEELPSCSLNREGFVVEETSAAPMMLDNTERCGISANHAQMIRFSTSESSNYKTVIEALGRYCREAPCVIARRQQHVIETLAAARSYEAEELRGTSSEVPSINQPFRYQQGTSERGRSQSLQYQLRPADRETNTQIEITTAKLVNKHFEIPELVSSKFIDREDMTLLVETALFLPKGTVQSKQQRRFVIHGVGGSGKTQFCCKFATDHRERYCINKPPNMGNKLMLFNIQILGCLQHRCNNNRNRPPVPFRYSRDWRIGAYRQSWQTLARSSGRALAPHHQQCR
jgi:hypothetical protein